MLKQEDRNILIVTYVKKEAVARGPLELSFGCATPVILLVSSVRLCRLPLHRPTCFLFDRPQQATLNSVDVT